MQHAGYDQVVTETRTTALAAEFAPDDAPVRGVSSLPSAPTISSDTFRAVFGALPTGVSVVTSFSGAGLPIGMTVSAVTALSLDPPQLLVCLQREKYTLSAIRRSGRFGVNFLSEHQADVSTRFASEHFDKFSGVPWSPGEALGAPCLDEALAAAECTVADVIAAGDHDIVIGTLASGRIRAGSALVYWHRGYHRLVPHEAS
jgi:flavin reductase (DIM6/NTAB) family NADH-FMN oxidoreductase RutF